MYIKTVLFSMIDCDSVPVKRRRGILAGNEVRSKTRNISILFQLSLMRVVLMGVSSILSVLSG